MSKNGHFRKLKKNNVNVKKCKTFLYIVEKKRKINGFIFILYIYIHIKKIYYFQ